MAMRVSVITPVYNALKYLQRSVMSALQQPETAEILLVEDGSTDGSLAACYDLEKRFPKIKVFRHPEGENRGVAASRNLGITNARSEHVAFLDADDFFLNGRFSVAARVFWDDPSVEGVYEAVGMHFESEASERKWRDRVHWMGPRLTTITGIVEPEQLFYVLLEGTMGSFHTNGVVLARSIFDKTGLFEESLSHHEDTCMWLKMAAVGRLKPGKLDRPVALRGIHQDNMTWQLRDDHNPHFEHFFDVMCAWGEEMGLDRKRMDLLRFRQWTQHVLGYSRRNALELQRLRTTGPRALRLPKTVGFLMFRFLCRPSTIFSPCLVTALKRLPNSAAGAIDQGKK